MPPRKKQSPSWRASGAVRLAGDPAAEVTFDALSERFIDADGDWKSAIPRPVAAVGLSMVTGGLESDFHAHRESQLFFLERGEVTYEDAQSLWIVPPRSALWIPHGVSHRVVGRAPLEGYSVFVGPDAAPRLPAGCCAVSVTPLLRELLVRLATRPPLYDVDGPDGRLVGVLLDELSAVSVENHRLPMPAEPRLRRLVDGLIADPASGAKMATWAKRIGMSERTLNRLLVRETGLSFGKWRQQLHVILALQKLARGASIQVVASDLGYDSASSFSTMFKKALGTSPAKYFADRLR